MRSLVCALLLLTMCFNLSACGNKGKLKSPSQIEKEEAKKAAKENGKKTVVLSAGFLTKENKE